MGVTVSINSLDEMCDLMCDNKLPKRKDDDYEELCLYVDSIINKELLARRTREIYSKLRNYDEYERMYLNGEIHVGQFMKYIEYEKSEQQVRWNGEEYIPIIKDE